MAVLALVILLTGFLPAQPAHAAAGPEFLASYQLAAGTSTPIREKNQASVVLKFSNPSGADLSDLYVEVDDASSFYGSGTNSFPVEKFGDASGSVTLPLIYTGTGNKLTVVFHYTLKDGGAKGTFSQTLNIKEAQPTVEVTPTPAPTIPQIDTSKIVPKLTVAGSTGVPTVKAGEKLTLSLPIKNTASYAAQNVSVSLEPEDKTKIPFQIGMTNLTAYLDFVGSNQSKNADFTLPVKSDAAAGVYAFKANLQYTNGLGDPFTSSETVYIKVVNDSTSPSLTLETAAKSPSQAVPGGKLTLKLTISNSGSLPANDVRVSLTGLKPDGFALDSSTDIRKLGQIKGFDLQTVSFALSVSSAIAGGSQPLGVKWQYKDETGTLVTEENQIFIPVASKNSGQALLTLDGIQAPQGTLVPKETFTVSFTVKNTGSAKTQNIKTTLTTDKELIPKSLSTIAIPALAPGESKKLSFALEVAADAATKSYPIGIGVEYDDPKATGESARGTLTQYVGVYVEGKGAAGGEGEGKSVPRIIVSHYGFEPQSVLAGQDTVLTMSILNTSRVTGVRNIKLTIASEDGTFTVDGSNSFFLEAIGQTNSVDRQVKLRAKPDADPKIYPITLNFEYEDELGNPFTSKETVSVPVQQNNRLVAGEVNVLGEAFPSQPVPISLDFYNMGKSTLYNLMIKAEGDFTLTGGGYYVGNFASGRTDTYDVSITPNAAGEVKGNIVFTFEDAAGKQTEVRKEFALTVMEQPVMQPDPNAQPLEPPPAAGKSKWKKAMWIGIPAAVVLGALTAGLLIRKKRRRRKELELDE
ncbi:COG1361 S-layer family protein [Gorillibacterium sp. sgz500922]|uniref:COG1361 S-layer family protein n=1 Tax=Gorillibacterium sp. sgz500922 TaxID=3446694 RepID=UPI003F681D31